MESAAIFSGGMGERMAGIRADAWEQPAWLGVESDPTGNARHDALISTSHSSVRVFIIAMDEEVMIAEHTAHATPAFP